MNLFIKSQITFKISKFLYINDEEIVRTMYKSIHRNEDKKLHDNNITQFLCVMNGGKLVQNCKNHALWGTHGITDGVVTYEITSTHHQMQYPYNLSSSSYDLLYKSEPRLSSIYAGDLIKLEKILECGEPEVVLYHKKTLPTCLAIQGHPEMIPDSPVAKMLSDKIHMLCKDLKK